MIIKILFGICAALLYGSAYLFGCTYQEMAVYLNIYLQAILWGITIAVLAVYALMHFRRMYLYLPWVGSQLYFLHLFVKEYFFLPVNTAFNRTMHGLENWADALGITYYEINLVLYILVYGSVLAVNIGLVRNDRNCHSLNRRMLQREIQIP